MARSLLLLLCVECSALIVGRASSQPAGLSDLYRLDRLPEFKATAKVASFSSYDRSGGNDDGFSGKDSFVRKDAEGLILADLKGPGIIWRIWTPTPTDDVLEFFFDGENQPRLAVKFRDLFLGKHPAFPLPLVGFGAGGYYSYVPLPFQQSCVVRIRAARMQFYQINYSLSAADAPLESFNASLPASYLAEREKVSALWNRVGQDLSPSAAPPGASIESVRQTLSLAPNAAGTAFRSNHGGRIVGLKVWPASAVAGKERDVLLRISFDGARPAVLCPLVDFFGGAWGRTAMQSLLVGTASETNYCYLPMPFERAAQVEIVSQRTTPLELHTEVSHTSNPRTDREGGFYALWRRENPTTLGQPFTFIETEGRGHLVGLALQAQGFEPGKTLFFEGDDETTLDGELVIRGTGSEDFFNGGWYDVPDRWEKRLCFPLSGCLGYAKHLGRTGAYRFFLGDAYAYGKSLRQTIEHSGEKNNILTDYCSVTYFYSERPPTANLEPLPLAQRAVLDPQEVIFPAWWQLPIYAWSFEHASLTRKKEKIGADEVRFLSLAATGQDWFGPPFLSPTCDVPSSGFYTVWIEAVKGPAQATIQLFQNENPAGQPVDLYAPQMVKSSRLGLGRVRLAEGPNNLMFKLVGKHEKSAGLGLDLISVVCVREP